MFISLLFILGGIKCHYCGRMGLCDLPYDSDEGVFIECDKSCLKFDG